MKRILSSSHIVRPLALAMALLALFCLASPLCARMVEVGWSPNDAQSEIRTRDDARTVGFKRAVYAEALGLLSGALDESRGTLLYQHLAPKAAEFVLSYSEVVQTAPAQATLVPGTSSPGDTVDSVPPLTLKPAQGTARGVSTNMLRMEVAVNRTELKAELKRLGVYFTVSAPQPYDLSLLGSAAGAWDEIGRLQTLTGVSVRRGTEPLLELNSTLVAPSEQELKDGLKQAAPMWTGSLKAEGRSWTASHRSLDALWSELWAGFFTRPGAEVGTVERVPLTVSGWYAPDGVQAFDKELAAWDEVVESAQLREILMLPDGIAAVWSVRTLDRAALRRKLDQNLPGRGLSWDFSPQPNAKE
ncbi:MAG: hypothetical protein KKE73_03090 [Proteobacteria bacterium]|nr:hypothetical protein [Pseudomonadota bacterium]